MHRKLTLISAPAGYGKTTLVCEWIAGCDRPAAWLSLEQGDNELTRFLTYMISALQTLSGNIGEGVLSVLQSLQLASTELVLTALLDELTAMPSPFILVLDDYHAASSKEVDEALMFLLSHLPKQMHLVITTREDPAISLPRLRVLDQITELRTADIRFTFSEAEAFFNHVMNLNLSTDHITEFQSLTEGWAAGLRLAAISIEEDQDAGQLLQSFTGNHHFVLDYLVEEVLQRQPENIQAFLLQTSQLDRLCGPLCDDLLLDPKVAGKEMLIDLERKNLFVIPLDKERRWYRYHHLFADILRKKSLDNYGADHIAELHKRASTWYEGSGFELDAFRHAIEAGDIERSSRLLQGSGMPLHLRGAARMTLNWLESLPVNELDARPELWVFYGSALLIAGKPTGVEHKLQAAEAAMEGMEQDAGIRDMIGWIAATRATLASLSLTDSHDLAELNLQSAEEALQDTELEDKTEGLVGLIGSARNAEVRGTNGIDDVIAQSRRALAYLHPDNLPARTASAWMLGVACQRRGDYAGACEAYNEVISNCLKIDHQLMAVTAMIGFAQIREAEGRPDLAAERYRTALKLAGDLPHPVIKEAQTGLERVNRVLEDGMRGSRIEPLSQREIEVLELIAQGLSNREIAEKLFLALDTVKGHNRRIFEKLHVQRRTEAIARARELNLFTNTPKPH
ncbi:LuxR C-terminal-related transcriptional regulator [Paenibacillus sp. UNC499MF]|uniref:LuxR C-terminal-related transcriptional regulator n=1 Tax=Paenibacillus sp. UNC499MF TaxID=1502751 RepID=UPI00089FA5D9|nr:LuxR C-terminal-related transcriptional regulator [Paenibacillus sp. UNC499MF]SEG23604.1 LuxR family transcriptional regulator, maltose regulon positive regulatory protein [Paenibacillus sp. UNC499MF]